MRKIDYPEFINLVSFIEYLSSDLHAKPIHLLNNVPTTFR
jgi:hypothetical protein